MKPSKQLRTLVTQFFSHWYNKSGQNTEEGFDNWIESYAGQICLNEVNAVGPVELGETQVPSNAIKHLATKFFYYWFNAPGKNTDQGFDDWCKTKEGQICLSEVKLNGHFFDTKYTPEQRGKRYN
jgi:uncharacterized protein YccT (UPF0319 family)